MKLTVDAKRWEAAKQAVLARLGGKPSWLDENGLNHLILSEYRKGDA